MRKKSNSQAQNAMHQLGIKCLTFGIFFFMFTAQTVNAQTLVPTVCNPLFPNCTAGNCGNGCCCHSTQYWFHVDVNCCIPVSWTTAGGCNGTACLSNNAPAGWYYSCASGDCPNDCIDHIYVQTDCGQIDLIHPVPGFSCTVRCSDGTLVHIDTENTCPCPSFSTCPPPPPGSCPPGYHFY